MCFWCPKCEEILEVTDLNIISNEDDYTQYLCPDCGTDCDEIGDLAEKLKRVTKERDDLKNIAADFKTFEDWKDRDWQGLQDENKRLQKLKTDLIDTVDFLLEAEDEPMPFE